MASYLVLPRNAFNWNGVEPLKVRPHEHRYGIFDFLREVEKDEFPFDRSTPLCIDRLDEFLIEAGCLEGRDEDKEWPLLQDIHRRLVAVANEISHCGTIQVPISYGLELGAGGRLYVSYTGKRVPLWRIFGQHPSDQAVGGHHGYSFAVTLS